MNDRLKRMLDDMHRYNSENLVEPTFGISCDTEYDALVIAPGWKPTKILDDSFTVTSAEQHSYISGYTVERGDVRLAWVQCASGACNLIDHLTICTELKSRCIIFLGAVGALSPHIRVGELVTPSCSISGVGANAYLCDKLTDYSPFGRVYPPRAFVDKVQGVARSLGYELREGVTFCTDSISLEYSHLDEIKAMGAELIEMETSSLYLLSEMLEIPAIALLAVSDNSASGAALIGRTEDEQLAYDRCRKQIIPELIYKIARMEEGTK